ncbi:hypothetical protein DL98DRAFT_513094 [Cadophora sp. DSE1049]|nr:hypothetical protein DL98DRAFT_513094 [Cadophora sp. DSE1049]
MVLFCLNLSFFGFANQYLHQHLSQHHPPIAAPSQSGTSSLHRPILGSNPSSNWSHKREIGLASLKHRYSQILNQGERHPPCCCWFILISCVRQVRSSELVLTTRTDMYAAWCKFSLVWCGTGWG